MGLSLSKVASWFRSEHKGGDADKQLSLPIEENNAVQAEEKSEIQGQFANKSTREETFREVSLPHYRACAPLVAHIIAANPLIKQKVIGEMLDAVGVKTVTGKSLADSKNMSNFMRALHDYTEFPTILAGVLNEQDAKAAELEKELMQIRDRNIQLHELNQKAKARITELLNENSKLNSAIYALENPEPPELPEMSVYDFVEKWRSALVLSKSRHLRDLVNWIETMPSTQYEAMQYAFRSVYENFQLDAEKAVKWFYELDPEFKAPAGSMYDILKDEYESVGVRQGILMAMARFHPNSRPSKQLAPSINKLSILLSQVAREGTECKGYSTLCKEWGVATSTAELVVYFTLILRERENYKEVAL